MLVLQKEMARLTTLMNSYCPRIFFIVRNNEMTLLHGSLRNHKKHQRKS